MKRTIINTYVNQDGNIVTVYKPQSPKKQITVQAKGSHLHCGKTNHFGEVK